MQSEIYKCFKCGKAYEEFDSSKYPYEHLCGKCNMKDKKNILSKIISIAFAIGFIVLLILGSIFLGSAQDSCSGDSCDFNLSENNQTIELGLPAPEYYNQSYTFEDNLKDPKCWYNINFCNLEPSENNFTSEIETIINTLKQVNYQQQDDVINCNKKLGNEKVYMYVLIGIIVLLGIWNISLTMAYRRKR